MSQEYSRANSSRDDEKHWMYLKPVRLYDMLLRHFPCKPWFLRRNLNYKNQEKGETRSASAGMVVFNFKDFDNTVKKTQVTKNCSCPFCYMLCGSFKSAGLQLHLKSFHEILEFEFMTSEENQTVNVSVRRDAFETKDQENNQEEFEDFSFCSKSFKRRQIGGRNTPKRLNVTILPMDPPLLADDTENGTSLLNNGNPVAMMNVPDIGQSSGSGASESDGTSEARSISLLQTRQFYHSRTLQRIDALEDVSPTEKNFMHLWNSFVKKQRVFTDGHVPWACEAISKFHKKEFIESKPLHSCWRMFMIQLWHYGLLDAVTINKCNLIIEDSEDHHHSDNTNNINNSVDRGIDLNRNVWMDADNNGVDRGVNLERNGTMDANNNRVDRSIDLNRNVTMDVNNVDRGFDLNDVMDVNEDVNDRG
ncbi:hypothetical protein Bca4012_023806 [Brassica carinata]